MNKPLKIISLYEIEEFPDAWEWLDLEECEYFKDNRMTLFEGDPDMLKVFGETHLFIDFETEKNHYVIVSYDVSDVEYYLESFFGEELEEDWRITEPNNWDSFWHNEESEELIAYRGGRGYCYTIWEFINKP